MVGIGDVEAVVAGFPGVTEGTSWNMRTWMVGSKGFAWERPFTKADVKRFGSDPVPAGPILAIVTDGLMEKDAILGSGTKGVFTIQHLNNYPAVLVQLNVVGKRALRGLLTDAWLAKAPPALAREFLQTKR